MHARLVQLTIDNIGLVESATLDLAEGLNCITGETGAGKSMILGALSVLTGERAKSELIAEGAESARVAGFFQVQTDELREFFADRLGGEMPDGELLLERRLRPSGRHSTRINGREVPWTLLEEFGRRLFEVQGQRAQLGLLEVGEQLEQLDRFAELSEEVDAYQARYQEARTLAARIDELNASARARTDRRVFLDHVIQELESAALVDGEKAALELELALLEDRQNVLEVIDEAEACCCESEGSIADRLGALEKRLGALGALHPVLADFARLCEATRASLADGIRDLRHVAATLEQDPGRLAQARERLDEIHRLEVRHRRSEAELILHLEELRREREELEEGSASLPELEARLRDRLDELGALARALGKRRRRAATKLVADIDRELAELAMPDAHFSVRLDTLGGEEAWLGLGPRGADRIEFLFQPNPGHTAEPLRLTASGGELSRVMLALKRAFVRASNVPILIFDEIDAGVGGRLGGELARKLSEIAGAHQVICVTHLPQIASAAARHFHVTKQVRDGRTRASIEMLDGERRVEEVAAMIRGKARTSTSMKEAREMILETSRQPDSMK